MKKKLIKWIFICFCLLILSLSIRGKMGNPYDGDINNSSWTEEGPFELSPERGRFALILSLIEEKSFSFSVPIARFATPDLGYSNGKYVSLFAPGVSLLAIPGYLIGRLLGIAQVGTFAVISLFAFVNSLLIIELSKKLGSDKIASFIGATTFLFATPAFVYGVSLYQHHITTFLILSCLYLLFRNSGFWSISATFIIIAFSLLIDYPNLFLLFPIAVFALSKIFYIYQSRYQYRISIKMSLIPSVLFAIIPLSLFLWFNFKSYNNPFQLAGTVASVKQIDDKGQPSAPSNVGTERKEELIHPELQQKKAVEFFNTRLMLNGLYVLIFSPDRGILTFAPVILFGIPGLVLLYRKDYTSSTLIVAIIAVNVLLYSMYGDPWGGWAFGSRYLIPTYALLSIGISVSLTRLKKNILFLFLFIIIMSYSIAVNTLGAITSSKNPHKIEVLSLEAITGREEKYTYLRNFDFLLTSGTKSFIFNSFLTNYISAFQFYLLIVGLIVGFNLIFIINIHKNQI